MKPSHSSQALAVARAALEADAPWYIEQHKKGLESAALANDFKAVASFTNPMIDRVWPKASPAPSNTVNIYISVRQSADLDAPPLDALEAEIIPEPNAIGPA